MVPRIDNRWLWFSLGVVSVLAVGGVVSALRRARRPDEAAERPESPQAVTQEIEDSISLESLRVLSRGPNYDIRNTAIRMLAERFADDALALSLLRADLQSGSPSSHASATNAHALLIRNLGHCPFAGASPSCPVCRARPARPARPDDQYVALGGEDGDDGNVEEAEATARPDDHTAEERAVRRRRREAMVLHEGDSPIVREDIIEPWPAADGERRPIRAEDVEQPREWEFF